MTEQGLYDIYGTWHVPFWQTKAFYYGVGLIGLLILFASLYIIIKKLCSQKRTKTSWDHALDELEQLRKNKVISAERGKEFYFAVTDILKRYLQARFEYTTQGKTDEELLHYLEKSDFPRDLLTDLRTIFSGSTTIKFANVQALQEQIEQDLERSFSFIKKTTPTNQ